MKITRVTSSNYYRKFFYVVHFLSVKAHFVPVQLSISSPLVYCIAIDWTGIREIADVLKLVERRDKEK